MLLDYSITRARRISLAGIVSIVLGTAALTIYHFFNGPWDSEQVRWSLLLALASIAFGALAIIRRRRFWWLGVAGLTMGAMEVGFQAYFLLTFDGFGNK